MHKRILVLMALAGLGGWMHRDQLVSRLPDSLGLNPTPEVMSNLLDWSVLDLPDPATILAPNTDPATINQSVWKVEGEAGNGSAFVIHPSGYLLTNRHVAGAASTDNRVRLSSMRGTTRLQAEIVSFNYCDDLALLRVLDVPDGVSLPYLRLSDTPLDKSGGERVAMYGYPSGEYEVDTGHVNEEARADLTRAFGVEDWFNTSAHLGPGSSGGPILNTDAEVVGVNVTADVLGRDQQGIDLYANYDDLQTMLENPSFNGYGSTYGPHPSGGIAIQSVRPDGLGEQFGLLAGDIVIAINNRPVFTQAAVGQLCENLRATTPTLGIVRGGETALLTLDSHTTTGAREREFLLPES